MGPQVCYAYTAGTSIQVTLTNVGKCNTSSMQQVAGSVRQWLKDVHWQVSAGGGRGEEPGGDEGREECRQGARKGAVSVAAAPMY